MKVLESQTIYKHKCKFTKVNENGRRRKTEKFIHSQKDMTMQSTTRSCTSLSRELKSKGKIPVLYDIQLI